MIYNARWLSISRNGKYALGGNAAIFGKTISALHGGCFMHRLLKPDALAVMGVM